MTCQVAVFTFDTNWTSVLHTMHRLRMGHRLLSLTDQTITGVITLQWSGADRITRARARRQCPIRDHSSPESLSCAPSWNLTLRRCDLSNGLQRARESDAVLLDSVCKFSLLDLWGRSVICEPTSFFAQVSGVCDADPTLDGIFVGVRR